MFDRDTWREIIETIRKHKLRTGLTALGVFWGIFMLIFVMGMGTGLKNGVFANFSDRANNIMYVESSRTTIPYRGFQPGRLIQLHLDDIQAIKGKVDEVEYIAPRKTLDEQVVTYRDQTDRYKLRGELSDMIKVEALKLYDGRYINQRDIEEARKVAVIGTRVKDVLFGKEECVGEYIRIRGNEYRVVGVFGPTQIKPWTEDDMEAVVIPLTTMSRSLGTQGFVDYFICSAAANVSVASMEPKVRDVLKERHFIHPEDPRGIGGFNLEEEFNPT